MGLIKPEMWKKSLRVRLGGGRDGTAPWGGCGGSAEAVPPARGWKLGGLEGAVVNN